MKTRLLLPVAAAAATAAVLALSPSRAVSAPKAYKVVEVKDGGTIRGTCRIKTEVPGWKVSVFKDNDKGCGEKEHATERLLVGADRGLGNCLVYLKSIDAGKDWPAAMKAEERTGTIDQKGCQYRPHLQWLRPETQMVILNSDAAEHNIHGYRGTFAVTQFNFASGPGKTIGDVEGAFLETPSLYIVKCDIHPWMNAYVHVVPHPYCDLTSHVAVGERKCGEFILEGVPPGEYDVVGWHEGLKETPVENDGKIASYSYSDAIVVTAKVKVEAGKTATQDFEFEDPALVSK